jgi:hypothetical protein
MRVYTCFDASGSSNPAQTDLKYYFLLRAWSHRQPLAGRFVDVHALAPRRKPANLQRELVRRMRASELLLVILSERTAASDGLVSWEIEFGATRCRLPIMCAYTGDGGHRTWPAWWPDALRRTMSRPGASAMHVPFHPGALARALATVRTARPRNERRI